MPISQITGSSVYQSVLDSSRIVTKNAIQTAYAYLGSTQNVTSGTWTKVQFNGKIWDTATFGSNFDTSLNRFYPLSQGYYHISAAINFSADSGQSYAGIRLYKNGSPNLYGNYVTGSVGTILTVNGLVFLNGATDYIELYGLIGATNPQFIGGDWFATYIQGMLVRVG